MLKLFGALTLGAVVIQYLNYLFIKLGGKGDNVLLENFKIILMTMPLQVIASLSFVYFYTQGVKTNIPYFYLSIMSIGFSMIMSLLVSISLLNGRIPTTLELAACIFTIIGIGLFIYSKNLAQ